MTRAQILAELREVLSDDVRPYKWTDTRLLLFLSLGQDQFCKDTGFFRDASSFTITTEAGTAGYAISARVVEVFHVLLDGVRLQKFSGDAPADMGGQPFAWQTDAETGMVTLYPTPDAVYTLVLRVWRKTLIPFSTSGDPEFPEDLQLAMVEWAAHLAQSDRDSERFDAKKAEDHKSRYEDYVREGKRAFRRLCAGHASFGTNPLYLV